MEQPVATIEQPVTEQPVEQKPGDAVVEPKEAPAKPENVAPKRADFKTDEEFSEAVKKHAVDEYIKKQPHDVRRMTKYIARAAAAEKEAEMLREQISKQSAQPQADAEPQREDFEDDKAYIKALTSYTAKKAVDDFRKEIGPAIRPEPKVDDKYVAEFISAHPDYDDAIDDVSDVKIPVEVVESIGMMELAPDLRYYLAKNRDVLQSLARMPVNMAIAKVGELHATIKAEKTKPRRQSAAPAPINPVGDRGTIDKKPDDMSYDEWKKERVRAERAKFGKT